MTRLMVVVVLSTQMATSMKVNGRTTWRTDTEFTLTLMVHDMKEIGILISSTVMVRKPGPTDPHMMASTLTVSKMGRVCSNGTTAILITASFRKIIYKVRVPTSGKMDANSKEIGPTIKYRAVGSSPGPTAANTRANTLTIKKMDRAPSTGQMAACIKEDGNRARWTETAHTSPRTAKSAPASGKKEREYIGLMSRESVSD